MISVLCPTVRFNGLPIVEKALKRQTEQDFEWVIGSPTKPDNLTIPFVWVQDPPKKEGDYWTLYSAYNEMIRQAQGDLIVSVQDHTFFDPTALEKFLFHFKEEPKTIVTGVGNKYVGVYPQLDELTWQDPRERNDQGTFYPCNYNDIELNFSAFPKEAFYAVGGFDEYLNKFSSACGLDVLTRLYIQGGWDFKIDQTNKSYSTEHGRFAGWEENNPFKNGVWQERIEYYRKHPVLEYLKK